MGISYFSSSKMCPPKNSFDFDHEETAFFRVQTSERLGTS